MPDRVVVSISGQFPTHKSRSEVIAVGLMCVSINVRVGDANGRPTQCHCVIGSHKPLGAVYSGHEERFTFVYRVYECRTFISGR